ncbi:MAG: hypothetical protein AAGK66_02810 [Pseudomonadota bacterium]
MTEALENWAIVEIMGHRQRAGFVQTVQMAGGELLRIDIPSGDGDITEYYGAGSIFSIRPCSEEIARDWCKSRGVSRPIRPVEYQAIEHTDDDELGDES